MALYPGLEINDTHREIENQIISNQPIKEDNIKQEDSNLLPGGITEVTSEDAEACCVCCQLCVALIWSGKYIFKWLKCLVPCVVCCAETAK